MAAALMNVTPENVLAARAAVLHEVESLSRYLTERLGFGTSFVGLCGGDPISRDAKELFTDKVRAAAIVPIQRYAVRLRDVADQLTATAISYGFTDQEINDSFRSRLRSLA